MGVDLLKHNQEAYEKVQKAISEGKKKIAVSHATGTGKSYLITKLFEDFSNDKKLVLVPSTYISDQIQKLFEKCDIQKADILRYQKLIKMSDEDIAAMDYDVIALDEYHHDTSKVWGNKVKTLIESHSESIIFGTSATPVRSDGVNTIDELFEGNCASDLPLSESIAKKIVPLPKYVGALYELDDELTRLRKKVEQATNTKEEKQEFYKKIDLMRSQIEKSYGMPIILNKHIKDKEGKYLVFCKKKRHLQEIKETVIGWFRTAGCKNINAYEVYSDYENKDAEYKAFCEDTSHNLKLLFCVNMLNEGLHLENISGVLLLRPTRSSIVWHQQIGRAIEANNTNTPVIIDAVNNFSAVGQGMELMREIKDAVTKEKESNPDFDDSGFEDIDTFFVLEQVVEIQEMFREIEGKLQGSWDLYIKALTQYKERKGDCLVPARHIEYINEMKVELGQWCQIMRQAKRGNGNWKITMERKTQLNQMGFVWDPLAYNFEINVKMVADYYKEHGKYPTDNLEGLYEKKLWIFLQHQKSIIRNSNYNLPEWKVKIIDKYLPNFSFETRSDQSFNELIYYLKLYKKQYGHLNIKTNDTIEGYNIGSKISSLCGRKNKCLPEDKLKQLEELGLYIGDRVQKRFSDKLDVARQAVNQGIVISNKNVEYGGVNFYAWIMSTIKRKYRHNELTIEQIKIIELLVRKKLDAFFHKGSFVKVVDAVSNTQIAIYKSQKEAARKILEDYNIIINEKIIWRHINGQVTTPYKGRFMFYYATDEEVKKYLEENKAK